MDNRPKAQAFANRYRLSPHYGVAFLAAILGFSCLLYQTSTLGPGISSDSVYYLSTAQNLVRGNGFIGFDGDPLLFEPPLFPMIIALLSLTGSSILQSARFLNAMVFGFTLFLACLLLYNIARHNIISLFGIIVLLFSFHIRWIFAYAWTEPLFIALTLSTLVLQTNYLRSASLLHLTAFGMTVALALLTRYIGISLILCGVTIILLTPQKSRALKSLHLTIFSLIALVPFMIWTTRNWLSSGTISGPRPPSSASLRHVVGALVNTLATWLLPSWLISHIAIYIVAICFFILWVSFIVFALSEFHGPHERFDISAVLPHGIFIGIYSILIVSIATRAPIDDPNDRMLSPIYISCLIIGMWAIDQLFYVVDKRPMLRGLCVSALVLWLVVYPVRHSIAQLKEDLYRGVGSYATTAWEDDRLVAYLRNHTLHGVIYSNSPEAAFHLGGTITKWSPARMAQNGTTEIVEQRELDALKEQLVHGAEVYVAWFNKDGDRGCLINEAELEQLFEVKVLWTNLDGKIFQILKSR